MSDHGSSTPAPPPPPGGGPHPEMPQGGGPVPAPPDSNLVWAILTTVFCCAPLGIVSIVYAAQVSSKWTAGDYAGAVESADKAKRFAIWAAVVGVVVSVLTVVGVLMLGLTFFWVGSSGGSSTGGY